MKKLLIPALTGLVLAAGFFQVRLEADQKETTEFVAPPQQSTLADPFDGPKRVATPAPSNVVATPGETVFGGSNYELSYEIPAAVVRPAESVPAVSADEIVQVSVVKRLLADGKPYETIETSHMPLKEALAKGFVPVSTAREDLNGKVTVETVYWKPEDREGGPRLIPHAPAMVEAVKPDVSRFRISIEYKLKNITPLSLAEFLRDEYPDDRVEFEGIALPLAARQQPGPPIYLAYQASGGYAASMPESEESVKKDSLTIKATIEDHKTIRQLLVEIEKEVEGLRQAAAVEPEKQIKIFQLKHIPANEKFAGELASFVSGAIQVVVEPTANSLIVSASPNDMGILEALLIRLDEKPEAPSLTVPAMKEPPKEALPMLDPEGVSRRLDVF